MSTLPHGLEWRGCDPWEKESVETVKSCSGSGGVNDSYEMTGVNSHW